MSVTTVKVSNISFAASLQEVKEFFSFSGEIEYVEMKRESERSQLAYITFRDPQGAETAMLLTGATIVDMSVIVTPVENYILPPEAVITSMNGDKLTGTDTAVKKAEDIISTMLAKGFVLGKDAVQKAKAFDDRHQLTTQASATVASLNQRIGLTEKISLGTAAVNEKVKEVDERFQVSELTKSAIAAAEQKVSSTGSALMSNHYVLTGVAWVSSAFSKVAKAAEDVSLMTKEKVERAEEEKKEVIYGQLRDYAQIQFEEPLPDEPPIVPVDSDVGKVGAF